MNETISAPREEVSTYAPKLKSLKLNQKKLKMLLVQVVKLSMKSLKRLVLKSILNKMVTYLFLHLKLKELIKQLKSSKILLVKQKLVKST